MHPREPLAISDRTDDRVDAGWTGDREGYALQLQDRRSVINGLCTAVEDSLSHAEPGKPDCVRFDPNAEHDRKANLRGARKPATCMQAAAPATLGVQCHATSSS
jgi:hypothetical protein